MKVELTENQLLALIDWKDYPELEGRFKRMRLKQGEVLYEARAPIRHAYFPISGTLSSVVVMTDGNMIEVATVGREGAVGLPTLAAVGRSPNRVFVQVPCEAMRIEAELLQKAVRRGGSLQNLCLRYHDAFIFQVSQSVACNGLHSVPERCCRWLLLTHDRVDGNELLLTHEFMSVMLGVRRPSVTGILQGLKERGLIRYTRGKITVLDREGLEEGSCECYQVVREDYESRMKGAA
jgi:CRP-like cAMP-binding protein